MKKYALIVAGGKGLRMGGEVPKQFICLEGKPILMWTLEAFHRYDHDLQLIVVLPHDQRSYWEALCREHHFTLPHRIADGGDTRFHSVSNGLALTLEPSAPTNQPTLTNQHAATNQSALTNQHALMNQLAPMEVEESLIAVHDGVRPFVSQEVLDRCFRAAEEHAAVIPVIPVIDTLRHITQQEESVTVSRSEYRLVQTPQVFQGRLLHRAYSQPYREEFTDDASVVESLGVPVTLVEGNRENIKLTTPFDLTIGSALLRHV